MKTHLEESLQRDIDHIREQVEAMSRLAVKALEDCVTALVEDDRQLAHAIILRDQYIDEKEKEIDRLCQEFLVKQQPVATQLRLVYSAIKINLEMERVGDYAESIARHLLKIQVQPSADITSGIAELAGLAIGMFRDSVQAFNSQDDELAHQTIAVEEAADVLKRKLNGELVHLFRENKIGFDELDALMTVVRRFERVSDQARNICMEALYLCTGEPAKHPADKFRVLFVDEFNSCRSQMAEAIAKGMAAPRFEFLSAGMEPKPVDVATQEFMATKGADLSQNVPQAVFQVPELDHFQVIVALARKAHRAFPQRPRKVIFLDWPVPDPSAKEGSDEEVRAAYERTYKFLETHITDLVSAILGSQPQSDTPKSDAAAATAAEPGVAEAGNPEAEEEETP